MDLMFEEGKKDEMSGKIQVKPGKTKEELHKNIEGGYLKTEDDTLNESSSVRLTPVGKKEGGHIFRNLHFVGEVGEAFVADEAKLRIDVSSISDRLADRRGTRAISQPGDAGEGIFQEIREAIAIRIIRFTALGGVKFLQGRPRRKGHEGGNAAHRFEVESSRAEGEPGIIDGSSRLIVKSPAAGDIDEPQMGDFLKADL